MENPTTQKQSTPKPKSSPFLRKPVPRLRAEREHDELDSGGGSDLSLSLRRHPLKVKQSYDSIPSEYGDDDTSRIGDGDPISTEQRTAKSPQLERHLTLVDLIAVGIGGTIGSGLFVLAGLVASQYAGPATVVSWMISGLAAFLSGCCYAELSGRIPLPGGAYAFNFVGLGELFAVVTAACLTLEYIVASAAVARSWGDKCVVWLMQEVHASHWVHDYLDLDSFFNPLALLISGATVSLLLAGVKESKAATNFFTGLKLIVVTIMVLGALCYVRPSNWVPFAPYGVGGVVRGATGTFFGYLGYDQVTALAGEAKNAKKNLPRAIMGVLLVVMLVYSSATLFLTGMQSYVDISPVSGFPDAFRSVGADFIAEIVSLGEIATLPIVILVTIMAQPRLQYAMSIDGLLPPIFQEVDQGGNLFKGTLIAGGLMALVASCVPFERLNDMISCSVLLVLALTDSSVVMLWHEGTESNPHLPGQLMVLYHCWSLVAGVALSSFLDFYVGKVVAAIAVIAVVCTCFAVYRYCPRAATFGGHRPHYHDADLRKEEGYFETPLVPFLPCLAIFVNWYLIAQLDLLGIGALMLFLLLSVIYYFAYAAQHSIGNNGGWDQASDRDEIELEETISHSDLSASADECSQLTN